MILVNFKTYSEASGKKARELAEKCMEASKDSGENVIVAPSIYDVLRLEELDIEVFSQHLDPIEPGSHTGHVTPEGIGKCGISGTLLNHSERRMEDERIKNAVRRAGENDLTTIVCAQNPEECGELSGYRPDYIAFEPPELIGGDTSVSQSKPELIEKAVERSSVPVLTGAGIHRREDVEKSMELGCEGVLVASGVVKDENPYQEVMELCRGL